MPGLEASWIFPLLGLAHYGHRLGHAAAFFFSCFEIFCFCFVLHVVAIFLEACKVVIQADW